MIAGKSLYPITQGAINNHVPSGNDAHRTLRVHSAAAMIPKVAINGPTTCALLAIALSKPNTPGAAINHIPTKAINICDHISAYVFYHIPFSPERTPPRLACLLYASQVL